VKNLIKRFPLAVLIGYTTTALAVLIVLQGSGVLTGTAAHWVDTAAGVLQVILTAYARSHVTPVANPKDAFGRRLVVAPNQPLVPPQTSAAVRPQK
jgi:hypothetical protein